MALLPARASSPDDEPPFPDDAYAPDPGAAIDLRAIRAALYRNRWLILGIVAGAMMVGVASILLSPRIYRADASIQIDQQASRVTGTEDTEPVLGGTEGDRFLQTQVDVLNSRSLARRVSDRLGLAADDAFLARMAGEPIGTNAAPALRAERVVGVLQANTAITLPRSSRVVTIAFSSRDPDLAARIANTFAEEFIASNIKRRFSTSDYSRAFLEGQLAVAKNRLEQSERDLIAYSRSAQLIDASAGNDPQRGGPSSLTVANLVQLNQSYAAAQAARLQAQQRWNAAAGIPVMALPEVLSNPAVQQLLESRAAARARVQQLRERLTAEHPTVQQAQAEVSEIEAQLSTLAGSLRASIRNQYVIAARQEDAAAAQVAALKTRTLAEQDRGVRYNILKREADTNRQLFESLLQRFRDVSAASGVVANNVSIIDTATPPRSPVSPRPLRNLAAALVVGLVLAAATVFARERFDDAIRNPQDIEDKLRLPLLAAIPVFDGDLRSTLANRRSSVSEAYHSARSAIELSSARDALRSLLVSSGRESEGKSTTAYSLARDFASVGRATLLIDGDLRRPSLHAILGVPRATRGLSSLLAGLDPLDAVIERTDTDNLSYMPAGNLPPNPAQLLRVERLAELLAELGQRFDIVVIDGPPVLALADAVQLAAVADATVVVVETGGAHFGQTKGAVRRLRGIDANLIGGIATKYDARRTGYGYGDYYSYRYGPLDEAA